MSLSEEVQSNDHQESELSSDEVFIDCPYCDISPKGLLWIQCHLAGIDGEIPPCLKIPSLIRSILKADLVGNGGVEDMNYTYQENLHADENEKELDENGKHKMEEKEPSEEHIKNENEKNHNADKIDTKLNGNGENLRIELYEEDNLSRSEKTEFIKIPVGMFLYENGLDSNVLNSPSFQKLICRKLEHSKQIPIPQEFKDSLREMDEYIVGVRESWAGTGCSILLDGWADKKGRRLMNVLADCPRGALYLSSHDITDFVEDMDAMVSLLDQIISGVGLSNVVQIITNSTSDFMVELGKRLMVKYRPIFWTVSVSSCIDLMLEKMSDLDIVKKTLESTKLITRFLHSRPDVLNHFKVLTGGHHPVRPTKKSFLPFSTLKNIVSNEKILKTIFLSDMSLTMECKRVAELVLGQSFWSDAIIVVKATIPLVLVTNWMDRNKSHMGYIYETLDQAKERIRDGIKEAKGKMGDTQKRIYGHKKFWEVVDDVWNNIFHSPIHSGGYFLNPEIFYSRDVNLDSEICLGMACCAVRYTDNKKVQDAIILILEYYRYSLGRFEKGRGIKERKAVSPAMWWRTYAGEHRELQRLAVRIESQTCDGASRYQLRRSLAEDLLTEGRDPVEQNKLKQKVFFKYNMDLKSFVPGMRYSPTADDIELMNDWIMDKSQK